MGLEIKYCIAITEMMLELVERLPKFSQPAQEISFTAGDIIYFFDEVTNPLKFVSRSTSNSSYS